MDPRPHGEEPQPRRCRRADGCPLADQHALHLWGSIVFDFRELYQLCAFPPFRAVGGEGKSFGTGLGRVGWATGFVGGKRGIHAHRDDFSKPAQDTKAAMSAPPDPALLEAADRGFDPEESIRQYLVRRPSERALVP